MEQEVLDVIADEIELQTEAVQALASDQLIDRTALVNARIRTERAMQRGKRRRVVFSDDAALYKDPILRVGQTTHHTIATLMPGLCPPLGPLGSRSGAVANNLSRFCEVSRNSVLEVASHALLRDHLPLVALTREIPSISASWQRREGDSRWMMKCFVDHVVQVAKLRLNARQCTGVVHIKKTGIDAVSDLMLSFLQFTGISPYWLIGQTVKSSPVERFQSKALRSAEWFPRPTTAALVYEKLLPLQPPPRPLPSKPLPGLQVTPLVQLSAEVIAWGFQSEDRTSMKRIIIAPSHHCVSASVAALSGSFAEVNHKCAETYPLQRRFLVVIPKMTVISVWEAALRKVFTDSLEVLRPYGDDAGHVVAVVGKPPCTLRIDMIVITALQTYKKIYPRKHVTSGTDTLASIAQFYGAQIADILDAKANRSLETLRKSIDTAQPKGLTIEVPITYRHPEYEVVFWDATTDLGSMFPQQGSDQKSLLSFEASGKKRTTKTHGVCLLMPFVPRSLSLLCSVAHVIMKGGNTPHNFSNFWGNRDVVSNIAPLEKKLLLHRAAQVVFTASHIPTEPLIRVHGQHVLSCPLSAFQQWLTKAFVAVAQRLMDDSILRADRDNVRIAQCIEYLQLTAIHPVSLESLSMGNFEWRCNVEGAMRCMSGKVNVILRILELIQMRKVKAFQNKHAISTLLLIASSAAIVCLSKIFHKLDVLFTQDLKTRVADSLVLAEATTLENEAIMDRFNCESVLVIEVNIYESTWKSTTTKEFTVLRLESGVDKALAGISQLNYLTEEVRSLIWLQQWCAEIVSQPLEGSEDGTVLALSDDLLSDALHSLGLESDCDMTKETLAPWNACPLLVEENRFNQSSEVLERLLPVKLKGGCDPLHLCNLAPEDVFEIN